MEKREERAVIKESFNTRTTSKLRPESACPLQRELTVMELFICQQFC